MLTLGCGPYFDEGAVVSSLILFLLVKPLAYFAFVDAFRFRVTRPRPLALRQSIKLAAARAGLGITIVGGGAALLAMLGADQLWHFSWILLYGERLFSWWLIGSYGASLRGRRLVGWVVSGTLINLAFDVAVVWGMLGGIGPQLGVVTAIALFIGALHVVGRRASLKARFNVKDFCGQCGYDLRGNVSGACPECGQPIPVDEPLPHRAAA